MNRDTAMRSAFLRGAEAVLTSPKSLAQPKLVKRVVRVIESGSGTRRPRAK